MVSWFPGDGNAQDILNQTQDLSVNGGVTFGAGQVAQAFHFDGTGDVTYSTINTGTAYTVDFWVRPTSSGTRHLVSNNPSTSSYGTLRFEGNFQLVQYIQSGSVRVASPGGSVPLNTYTHVALTYDGQVNRLYINGNLVSTSAVHSETLNDPISLGFAIANHNGEGRFIGRMDEVEIFSRALSQSEIQSIVSAGSAGKCKMPVDADGDGIVDGRDACPNTPAGTPVNASGCPAGACFAPPANLRHWFPGDGNPQDIAGVAQDLSVNGGVTFPAGKVAQAIQFDGTGDVTYSTIDAGSAYTIDLWVRPTSSGTRHLVSANAYTSGYGTLRFEGNFQQVQYIQSGSVRVASPGGSVPLNTYTHIALTYDGQVNRLYINGNLVSTSVVHTETFNNPISLGFAVENLNGEGRFIGQMDEVQIFSRALSQTEVRGILNADTAGKCKTLTDADGDGIVDHRDACPDTPPSTVINAAGCPVADCFAPPAGMTNWFAGDGNANDIRGSNDGTPNGGVTFAPGKVAQAFQFDGTGDVAYSTINAGTAYTVDFWVRPTSSGTRHLISNQPNTQSYGTLRFDGNFQSVQYIQSASVRVQSPAGSVPLNTYTHVALTYDGQVNRLYINGHLAATSASHTETFSNPVNLGYAIQNPNGESRFIGQIDEVEIFSRALSQTEIRGIVYADTVGKCKCPEIVLTPESLPNATVGIGYNQTITPSAGAAPFSFAITKGTLPPGLTLNASTGVISGTPTSTAGSPYTFTVTVVDANDCRGEHSYSIGVSCAMIVVNPSSLPNGTVGAAYSQTISASGGSGTYSFAITAGALPPGLSLNSSTGVISGTPSGGTGSPFTFAITATDAFGCSGSRGYSIAVNCPAISLAPNALSNGVVGTSYNQTISASGSPGPFTFAITSGGLPSGLSLNSSTGQISGTPSAAGTFNFEVTATDQARGCSGSRSYAIVISAVAPPCVRAGTPDVSFSGDGFVATAFTGAGQNLNGIVRGLTRQADGKIIAAGYAGRFSFGSDSVPDNFALARYNQDGSLDPSWGGSGRVLTSFAAEGANASAAAAVVALSDGKIVAAGVAVPTSGAVDPDVPTLTPTYMAVVRYNSDGSLDSTFGSGGKVLTAYGLTGLAAMAVQPDGKILLTGYGGGGAFLVVRLNANGSSDNSFDEDGIAAYSFGPATAAEPYAIAVQTDGKIVVGGRIGGPNSTNSRFALLRCDSSGVVDPSFGENGWSLTDFGFNNNDSREEVRGIVLQSDGKIVSAGGVFVENTYRFGLTRHNTDGTLDSSFGSGGMVSTNYPGWITSAVAVSLQADNKIVVTGNAQNVPAIARYHPNGVLDADLGENGRVLIISNLLNSAGALLVQPNGDVVVGGTATVDEQGNFALARLVGSGCPSTIGKIAFTTASGGGAFHISTINLDGTGESSLTTASGGDSQPSYSRDGSRIVFARYLTSNASPVDIYAMNSDGTNQVRLTTDANSSDPSLSGDRSRIAYVRAGDIWVMNADGSNQTQLTSNPLNEGEPAFSVDGAKIAFIRSGNIWVMNADGSAQAQLTTDLGYASPSFHPDSTKLLFTRNTDIFVMNSDGTNTMQLTGSYSTFNQTPAFSPDGTQIVYSGARPNDLIRLHVMAADGSNPTPLVTQLSQSVLYPSWGGTAATFIPLTATSAVSRKMHGALGPFDIPLPLTGAPGVECRSSSGHHTLVFSFSNGVIGGSANVTNGTGSISGAPTFSGNTMTINLTGVSDVQRITVTLSGVTDSFGQVLPDLAVNMILLVGDTTGNRSVNASDIGQTKSQSGSPVTNANFRQDVTANGSITASDIGFVKSRAGATVP
jgi:uncharacterized delta-60 repeat protein